MWTALLMLYFWFHILCKVHLCQDEEILEDNFFQFMRAYQRLILEKIKRKHIPYVVMREGYCLRMNNLTSSET